MLALHCAHAWRENNTKTIYQVNDPHLPLITIAFLSGGGVGALFLLAQKKVVPPRNKGENCSYLKRMLP